ncbi:MAG: FAD binding domain-containing protein [Thermoplasmata archaeon]|nr:FAD binding domain-containing protein [Thermoplasmata archaeon]
MSFTLVAPETPEEAVGLLAAAREGETVVLAGGSDLLLDLGDGRSHPTTVLSLRRLPWNEARWEGSSLVIGSTAPLSALEADPRLRHELPGLWSGLRAVGSVALRHRATVGGNLGRASPASDLIPVLLALDATVELIGPAGHRTLPLDALILGPRATALSPGELIESITIPEGRPSSYVWQRVRPAHDISQVGVAAAWSPSGRRWSIAVGGTAPVPGRSAAASELGSSRMPGEALVAAAAQSAAAQAQFLTDKRASEEYRRRVLATLFRRAVDRASREENA